MFVYANDSPVTFFSGSVSILEKEESISMESEEVHFYLYKDYYIVDGRFNFYNSGNNKELMVGFPRAFAGYYGDIDQISDFTSYEAWVNNISSTFAINNSSISCKTPDDKIIRVEKNDINVKAELAELKPDPSSFIEIKQWLIRKIVFPSKSNTETRIRYKAKYEQGRVCTDKYFVYIYGSGRPWKGNIKKAKFIVHQTPECWINFMQINDAELKREDEYTFYFEWENFEPGPDEIITLYATEYFFDQPWDDGCHASFKYKDKEIPENLLNILSIKQAGYLRNSIFAAYGKRFNKPEYVKYFNELNWYNDLKEKYGDDKLTDTDKRNVSRLLKLEEELKKKYPH